MKKKSDKKEFDINLIMFNCIFRNRKHPPIGCKYTKYNLVPHFIGDFFVSLYCPL
jgi:hypothetical protein